MTSRHTVTGTPPGRPAHAVRPGVPAAKIAATVAGLAALAAAGWFGIGAVLKSTGPTTTTPVSASLITVTPSPATPDAASR